MTTVARTLFDLAPCVDASALRRAVEEADRLNVLDLRALAAVRDGATGRRVAPLDAVLADLHESPAPHSELERRFGELCDREGLPPPSRNALVVGFEVDALWAQRRLIVELDGFSYHRSRAAFERDRRRDAALMLAGYRVLRISFRRLADDPRRWRGLFGRSSMNVDEAPRVSR